MGCGASSEGGTGKVGGEALPPLLNLRNIGSGGTPGNLFRLGLQTGVEYFIVAEDAHDGLCATFADAADTAAELRRLLEADDDGAANLQLPPGIEPLSLRLAQFSHDLEEGAKPALYARVKLHASQRTVQHAGATVIFEFTTDYGGLDQTASSSPRPLKPNRQRYALGTFARPGGVAPLLVRCALRDDLTLACRGTPHSASAVSIEWAVSMCGFASHDDAVTICSLPPAAWQCDTTLPALWHEPCTPAQPTVVVLSLGAASGAVPSTIEIRRCPTAASLSEELHVLEQAAPRCALRLVTVEDEWNQCLGTGTTHDVHRDGLHGCWTAIHWSDSSVNLSGSARGGTSPVPQGDVSKPHDATTAASQEPPPSSPLLNDNIDDRSAPFDESLGPLACALLLACRDPLPKMPSRLPATTAAIVVFAMAVPESYGLPHTAVVLLRRRVDGRREVLVANAAGTTASFVLVEDIVYGDGAPDLLKRMSFRTKSTSAAGSTASGSGSPMTSSINGGGGGSASSSLRRNESFTKVSRLAVRSCGAFEQALHLAPMDPMHPPASVTPSTAPVAAAALCPDLPSAHSAFMYRTSPQVNCVPGVLPRFAAGLSFLVDPATSRVVRCLVPLAGAVAPTGQVGLFDVQLLVFGKKNDPRHSTALLRLVPAVAAAGATNALRVGGGACYGAVVNGALAAVVGDTALESLLHSTYADALRFKWDIAATSNESHVALVPKAAVGMALRLTQASSSDSSMAMSIGPHVFDSKREAFLLHPIQ